MPRRLSPYARRVAERVQQGLRRLGYELNRYEPGPRLFDEDVRRAKLLQSEGINLVLDVGANAGQYAKRLRRAGYGQRIVSFEPLAQAYAELERQADSDALWSAHRLALSDEERSAEIHVSANSWSSSLLAMGERHLESAPDSAYVGTETVTTARLDAIWDQIVRADERVFLKMDVQGFEMHVLRGAEKCLAEVAGIQAELALVHLYEGDSSWRTVIDHIESRGFELAGLEPGFEDPVSGRMLQADGIFVRGR
jgi:FkbM family methyltransferase